MDKIRKTILQNIKQLKTPFVIILIYFMIIKSYYFLLFKIVGYWKKPTYIINTGLFLELFFLLILTLIIFVLTKRKYFSVFLTVFFYSLFIVSNIVKINYLGVPIYIQDFLAIGDLVRTWELFKLFLPYLVLALGLVIFIIIKGKKFEKEAKKVKQKRKVVLIFLIITLVLGKAYKNEIRIKLWKEGIFDKKNANLIRRGIKYGYLTNFVQAAFFSNSLEMPKEYNEKKINDLVKKYKLKDNKVNKRKHKAENIIVLFIESFTDPSDFGWSFYKEPLPTYKSLKKEGLTGFVISPVFGGKSVNAEFELMTGLTNRYTPTESSPYLEFVNHNVPSLPRTLKNQGFTTNAIQVIKFKGFGYGKIYNYLDVDNKISLHKKNNNSLELDPSGKTASSYEIAKKIIELTDQQEKSFIFVFPNSTHSPWYLKDYPNTKIKLKNTTGLIDDDNTISAYANALNHIDYLIKTLVEKYKTSSQKTLLVVLGDHQPGISAYTKNYTINNKYGDYMNNSLKKYKVPILIWSNYLEEQDKTIFISTNLLPSFVLDLAGLDYKGFMKFNSIIRKKLKIVSNFLMGVDGLPAYNSDEVLKDYNIFEYDILFGEKYILKEER